MRRRHRAYLGVSAFFCAHKGANDRLGLIGNIDFQLETPDNDVSAETMQTDSRDSLWRLQTNTYFEGLF